MIRYFSDHTSSDRFDGAGTIAILPLGATEAHGAHLPLGTDGHIVDGILNATEPLLTNETVTVLRLPVLWFGASEEHLATPGTLSISAEQTVATIVTLGEGLAAAGVSRLLLFNGHGGNIAPANIAALRLRRTSAMLVGNLHWLDLGLPAELDPPTPLALDVHGGWVETSVLMHLRPDLVRAERSGPHQADPPAPCLFPTGPVSWGWETTDLSGKDCVGRPDLARAELGACLIAHAARSLAHVVEELALAAWPPKHA